MSVDGPHIAGNPPNALRGGISRVDGNFELAAVQRILAVAGAALGVPAVGLGCVEVTFRDRYWDRDWDRDRGDGKSRPRQDIGSTSGMLPESPAVGKETETEIGTEIGLTIEIGIVFAAAGWETETNVQGIVRV